MNICYVCAFSLAFTNSSSIIVHSGPFLSLAAPLCYPISSHIEKNLDQKLPKTPPTSLCCNKETTRSKTKVKIP